MGKGKDLDLKTIEKKEHYILRHLPRILIAINETR